MDNEKKSHQYSGGNSNTPAQRTDKQTTEIIAHRELKILLDWLGFTVNKGFYGLNDVINIFEMYCGINSQNWSNGRKNYQGYADSLVYENINIYYNGAENQGIHVDITGQGCRFIETNYKMLGVHKFNWLYFFTILIDMNAKFTRLDLACDDFYGFFNVPQLFNKCMNGELTSKFKSWRPDGNFDMNGQANGITIYFGSVESRLQIVFYEKNKQLGLQQNWTRTEIRFKQERAQKFAELMLLNYSGREKQYDIGVMFAGVLKDNITFREKSETDTNKRRWKVSPFWMDFLKDVERLRLAEALPDRSLLKIRSWWDRQNTKSLAILYYAYQDTEQDGKWLIEMLKDGHKKLKDSDLKIIEEYKRIFKKEKNIAIDRAISI